jgi:hypothetical protein
MGEISESRYYDKKEVTQELHRVEMRNQVLEMTLRGIAEQPTDDAKALQHLALQGLKKAGEAKSSSALAS